MRLTGTLPCEVRVLRVSSRGEGQGLLKRDVGITTLVRRQGLEPRTR
jgi:hypothetical protein